MTDYTAAKKRIMQIAEEEFPGCRVDFDEDAGDYLRFKIASGDTRLSRGFPHLKGEVNLITDEELRSFIRQLCGL
jgi:hypothetical protein